MTHMRPPVHPPRDLGMPERLLYSALALLDCLNPFPDSFGQCELMDEPARAAQVAGLLAMEDAERDSVDDQRRLAWRARFGSPHPASVGPGITDGRQPYVLKSAAKAAEAGAPAKPTAVLHAFSTAKKRGGR